MYNCYFLFSPARYTFHVYYCRLKTLSLNNHSDRAYIDDMLRKLDATWTPLQTSLEQGPERHWPREEEKICRAAVKELERRYKIIDERWPNLKEESDEIYRRN